MTETIRQVIKQKKQIDGWLLPRTHHLTTMYGKAHPDFTPGTRVDIDIRAIVYIPDKIITGVCFPDFEVQNEMPHVTLMVSEGWPPVLSNQLLTLTAKQFKDAYEAARDGILPAKNAGVLTVKNVKINKGSYEAVFVLLREPVLF